MKQKTVNYFGNILQVKVSPIFIVNFFVFFILIHLAMGGKNELQSVIQSNGLFTKQLFNILSRKEGNVIFSPISVHAVLSMAYQGSSGSSYEAFTKALNIADHNLAAVGYSDILGQLNNLPDVDLSMANKIYIMDKYSLKPNFKEVTEKKFLSAVESIDFSKSDVAAKSINDWVEKTTKNKIKDLIQSADLTDMTRLVLLNAIYFKGNWAAQFDASNTHPKQFYLNDTESIEVPMMRRKGKYNYKEDEDLDAKVLEMPYSNDDVSMIIILPNKRNGIAELEQKLANVDLTKITEHMFRPEVVVELPKFKIETTIDLIPPLEELGLGVIFDGNKADFSQMLESTERLHVSKVVQKAFIEVNEKGTEAAAATGAVIRERRSLQLIKEFVVDRPFLCLIVNRKNGVGPVVLLFLAKITQPEPIGLVEFVHEEL